MSERASGPERPRGARVGRVLVLALAIVAVLIASAWVALAVAFPPARLRALVQDRITRTLKRETRFESVGLSLWPPVRLTVRDPALAEPGGFAAGTALRAQSVHLDLDLLGLLARRLIVRRLEIAEPFAHVVLLPGGGSNFDGMMAPPRPASGGTSAGPGLDLLVEEFRVRDGRLQLDDAVAHRRVVLDLETRLGFSSEAGGQRIGTSGTWTISKLAFGPDQARRLADLDHSLSDLTWNLEHRGRFDAASRRLTLDRLALLLGRSEIVVSGVVDDPGAHPVLDLAVRGEKLDLGQIVGFLAAADLPALKGAKGSGEARFDLGLKGPPAAIAATGRIAIADGAVQGPGLPKKIEGLSGTVEFSPARVEVRNLTARAGQSSFTFAASATRPLALLAKPGSAPPSDVQFRLDSPYLDLAELLPPGPSQPARFNARGGGEAVITRLRNQKLDVRNVRAKVVLAPSRIEVPSFTLDGYGGAVGGKASFGFEDPARPTFSVKARADSVRANDFLSAWTPAAGLLNGSVNANFDLAGAGSQPRQVLESLTAVGLAAILQGHLKGPALDAIAKITGQDEFRDLRFNDLHLPFRVERGRVVTDPVQLSGPYGDWRLIGAVGFNGALDYAVSITLPREVSAKLGSAAALAAAGLTDAQGRTLLDLTVTGSAHAPRVALDTRAMRERLAGRGNATIAEQRERLERQAVEQVLGRKLAPDSAGAPPVLDRPQVREELQKKANDLLENLFGKKKAPPAPPATPPSRPPDSVPTATPAPDTTGH